MVMEFEGGLEATKWTSNTPHPFSRAPGAGLGEAVQRRPRRAASLGALHDSGFAAEPVGSSDEGHRVVAKAWTITTKPVLDGQVASMLVKLRFTDRGTLDKAQLDSQISAALEAAGFKTSKASSFTAVPVTWAWKNEGDLYFPVVATPAEMAGVRYSGNAVVLPAYSADPKIMQALPNVVYVYTLATTSNSETMTTAEGAKVLSVFKAWLAANGQRAGAYATGTAVMLGSDPKVFPPKPSPVTPVLKASAYGLVLLAAWNLMSPHIGSERL